MAAPIPLGMAEQKYNRLALALEQLDVALSLFLDRQSYACAITLAGAAEEVFGKEVSRRGHESVLDWEFGEMAVLHKWMHGKELPRKTFVAEKNLVRNALKHLNESDTIDVVADLRAAACWMLVRACENAKNLELRVARFEEFNEWFYEHAVGV
jgi:hypothetical protein